MSKHDFMVNYHQSYGSYEHPGRDQKMLDQTSEQPCIVLHVHCECQLYLVL